MTEKQEKFTKIIQKNERLIYKVASMYVTNRESREDLIQEIVFNLWKSFDSFQEKSSISTWMYRVALNVSIYHFKKSKKEFNTFPITEEIYNKSIQDNLDEEEKWKWLREQISELNLLDRGIVLLYLEGKNYKEIAEVSGISESNVGTRLQRIRQKLRKQASLI